MHIPQELHLLHQVRFFVCLIHLLLSFLLVLGLPPRTPGAIAGRDKGDDHFDEECDLNDPEDCEWEQYNLGDGAGRREVAEADGEEGDDGEVYTLEV